MSVIENYLTVTKNGEEFFYTYERVVSAKVLNRFFLSTFVLTASGVFFFENSKPASYLLLAGAVNFTLYLATAFILHYRHGYVAGSVEGSPLTKERIALFLESKTASHLDPNCPSTMIFEFDASNLVDEIEKMKEESRDLNRQVKYAREVESGRRKNSFENEVFEDIHLSGV